MSYLLIPAALVSIAAAGGILVHFAMRAPAGFEDEDGFHLAAAPVFPATERRASRRVEKVPGFGGLRYVGPLRRSSDFNSGSGRGTPFSARLAFDQLVQVGTTARNWCQFALDAGWIFFPIPSAWLRRIGSTPEKSPPLFRAGLKI